ncbi:beta-fructofuranosidase [Kineosphaera limosa]|uniref:beta-fructofuranosidase n=1 Tax=Kineosphaera limosa NBRC 100340 TaxID=1184609 RepID=K6X9Q2_9MICO|nr:glycoside hydrolase family 32 protein [Kineosphaera limosa]NYD99894.1 beta-fructofuranosidase [Kineosphaera limosa]GAB95569.1 putative glycoside hydrolase [Kineosphaera limosa NBRC 100340]
MPAQSALPSYHIRPGRGWLNDPNGMTYRDGRWHVFYQHNPAAAVHGDIHWGHVSSDDLATWTPHPVAFGPTPDGPDRAGCWSGVFVPDSFRGANEVSDSGVSDSEVSDSGAQALVAYSAVSDETAHSTTVLRRALDSSPSSTLDEWSEPWVVATTPEADEVAQMRDPFLFTFGGRRWALHGAGLTDGSPAVLLFGCDDPDAWTYEGLWFTGAGALGAELLGRFPADIWECPQLVLGDDSDDSDGRAVLVLATQHHGSLDDVVAVVGDLEPSSDDPTRPAFNAAAFERLDLGDACYAPQFAEDPTGSWHLGWVRQSDVPADPSDPDADLVAGCLTLPRRIGVVGDHVVVTRAQELDALLSGDSRALAAGGHELPSACVVRTTGGTLGWPGGVIDLPPVPVEVWVDGEVVEVYPVLGATPPGSASAPDTPRVPATYRRVGATWRLDVPTDDTAWLELVALGGAD